MKDYEFWRSINRLSMEEQPDYMKASEIIREAYDENLSIICGCMHTGPDMVNQLYVNIDENDPTHADNRYMLCYTSWQFAEADHLLPEPAMELPVRFVVDNALNKRVIGGLLFNRATPKRMLIVPKQFLSVETIFDGLANAFRKGPGNLFPFSDED